ncbi:hypothetical protein IV203_032152 [Nitzschia inconspicua]|uniref:Uncharacterized protein n=1 Tax=Nitzschia inconspicua TaxID=303405 RepID=A0A9K3LVR4_9STRA|nr:hypothetical protein IV203_032152 [Nitzschia inconspicua]
MNSDNNNNDDSLNKISVSPGHGWSPHTAALHRRRKFDAQTDRSKLQNSLGMLSLDDDDDDILLSPVKPKSDSGLKSKTRSSSLRSPTKGGTYSPSTRVCRSKSPGGLKTRNRSLPKGAGGTTNTGSLTSSPSTIKPRSPTKPKSAKEIVTQDDIPLDVLEKLAILTDTDVPLKERVQVEVDMLKNPFEKKIMVDFRHTFDRKAFLSLKAEYDEREQRRINKDIMTEEEKEREFKQYLAKKRQQEIEEEIAKAEREAKLLDDARKHAVKSIAEGMEQVRKDAEKTVQVASESRLKKKMEQEALEAELERFRRTEGKYMHEAQRALKEALIEQKYVDREL